MKMMTATLARIGALRFDAMPLGFLFALRARIVLAETNFKKVVQAGFIVAKLREKFSDCHAVFVTVVPVFHALNIRLNRYVCQGDNSEFIVQFNHLLLRIAQAPGANVIYQSQHGEIPVRLYPTPHPEHRTILPTKT
jgi:hypothetical protein